MLHVSEVLPSVSTGKMPVPRHNATDSPELVIRRNEDRYVHSKSSYCFQKFRPIGTYSDVIETGRCGDEQEQHTAADRALLAEFGKKALARKAMKAMKVE